MVYTLIAIETISALILASTLLYRYGDVFRNHIIVSVSVLLAWYFSFLIMFVLPLDITSTVYRQCKLMQNETLGELANNPNTSTLKPVIECQPPWSNVPEYVFPNFWRVVYWSSQFLTWLIMPMMQSYAKSGDFTVKGKLKAALGENAIYYGSYLAICGVLLIYLAFKQGEDLDYPKIKAIASSASNTWGLFLLILLLGYALVEVPRSMWFNAKKNYTLNYTYFKAAKLSTEKAEAEETIDDILNSMAGIVSAVGPDHPLMNHVEEILQKFPVELRDKLSQIRSTQRQAPTLKTLVNIHKKVIKALHVLQRTDTQWYIVVQEALHLEDVVASQRAPDRRFRHSFPRARSKIQRIFYPPSVEWYWECFLKSYFLRVMAVLTGIVSFCVVWSEVTFFSKSPVLSIFAIIVNFAKVEYNYAAIVTMSTFVISYLCYCAYSTVLRIKFLNLYYLAANHQTNEHSLIFSGMMACRLTPPLCLNFLGLIHMDSHIVKSRILETYYTQIMGHMDVLSIIADGFNIYFPMALLLFCTSTMFRLGSRLLSFCGFQQFIGDDELTIDLVDEGREILKRERRKRLRQVESENRHRIGYRSRDRDASARVGLLADTDTTEQRIVGSQSSYSTYTGGDAANIKPYPRHTSDSFDRDSILEDDFDVRRNRSTFTQPPASLFDDV